MKQEIAAISKNLKNIRESRGLSLDQVSTLTGVSKSMLRQIETGKSNPTIAVIWKIANGLKVSFTALLSMPKIEAKVQPFRGENIKSGTKGYKLFPLIPFEPERPVETYYIEIEPGTTFHGEPHHGNVYEYLFVTEGTVEVMVQGKTFAVNEDEFIQFEANHPHDYRCKGDIKATALMQISYL